MIFEIRSEGLFQRFISFKFNISKGRLCWVINTINRISIDLICRIKRAFTRVKIAEGDLIKLSQLFNCYEYLVILLFKLGRGRTVLSWGRNHLEF